MSTNTLPLYLDQLDSARREVFIKLRSFAKDYTLAGGTAIMFHIGHRKSYDFDLFSLTKLPIKLRSKIRYVFGSATMVLLESEDLLLVKTPSDVEIHFAWHPYPPLCSPIRTSSIPMFHMDDLITNKALTIGRRKAWRDYVDLFIALKWNLYTLKKITALAQQRFGGEFNPKLFLLQLTYFDDLDITDTIFLKESYSPEDMKKYLKKQSDIYLKTFLEK